MGLIRFFWQLGFSVARTGFPLCARGSKSQRDYAVLNASTMWAANLTFTGKEQVSSYLFPKCNHRS